MCIKQGLDEFCLASGQRVNNNKSRLFVSPNLSLSTAEELGRDLNIPLTQDLGTYLGHRIIHRGRSTSKEEDIVQRIRNKMSGWKSHCLSRAGRLTLARSVLCNMGVFYMQMQKLSSQTHKEIDKAVRDCVWGSSANQRRVHLLDWATLCRTKKEGGAGLRRAEDMNRALLAKLGWRMLVCGDEAWCKLIKSKYGVTSKTPPFGRHGQRDSHVWRGISWGSELLRRGLRWRARNGERVLFWEDRWLEDSCLGEKCVRLVGEEDRIRTVASYWRENGGWNWESIGDLLPAITLMKLAGTTIDTHSEVEDSVGWLDVDNKKFTVKSAYELLTRRQTQECWKGWSKIWRLKVQERTKVFLWVLAHDRIMTNGVRWRRKLAACPNCARCSAEMEDGLHAIRDCSDSREVWNAFVPPVMLVNFFALELQPWILMNLEARSESLYGGRWPQVMAQICWYVWRWRCLDIFEGQRLSLSYKVEHLRESFSEMEKAFVGDTLHQANWGLNKVVDIL